VNLIIEHCSQSKQTNQWTLRAAALRDKDVTFTHATNALYIYIYIYVYIYIYIYRSCNNGWFACTRLILSFSLIGPTLCHCMSYGNCYNF
jgi:hypothetical protein